MKTLIHVLMLSLVFFANNTLLAAIQNPEEIIKEIFNKAASENLLNNKSKRAEVESLIDFSEMSKSILAKQYTLQPAAEIKWFESTIKEIITRSVYPSAPKFLDNVKISYKKTATNNDLAKVSSSVRKKGEAVDVEYVLKKTGLDWKIVDVAIDEESWVSTINEKVQKTIKEKGWSGLKTLLNNRLKELKNSKN